MRDDRTRARMCLRLCAQFIEHFIAMNTFAHKSAGARLVRKAEDVRAGNMETTIDAAIREECIQNPGRHIVLASISSYV